MMTALQKLVAGLGFACIVVVGGVVPASAQIMREHNFDKQVRGFHGVTRGIGRSFQSDTEAKEIFTQILSTVGLAWITDRIQLRASDVANAEARYDKESQERFIFYNATFMQQIKAKSGNYWSLMSILAHEVGHHLAFHVEIPGRNHEFELEADYFSGFVLGKLGATLDEAQAAMRGIGSPQASESHPALGDRLQIITIGWTDGRNNAQPRNLRNPASPMPGAAPAPPPPAPAAPPLGPTAAVIPKSSAIAPPQRSLHYVDDTRPPDAWLALRSQPGSSQGSQLARLTNGTMLEVIERRADGWWRVRVSGSGPGAGQEGWVLNRAGDRVWIHCCRAGN